MQALDRRPNWPWLLMNLQICTCFCSYLLPTVVTAFWQHAALHVYSQRYSKVTSMIRELQPKSWCRVFLTKLTVPKKHTALKRAPWQYARCSAHLKMRAVKRRQSSNSPKQGKEPTLVARDSSSEGAGSGFS